MSEEIQARYTHSKGVANIQEVPEEMRSAYEKADESYLTTKLKDAVPREQLEAEITKKFLSLALRLKEKEIDELQKEYGHIGKIPPRQNRGDHPRTPASGHRGTYASNSRGNGRQVTAYPSS